jgi:type II secretion system protein G
MRFAPKLQNGFSTTELMVTLVLIGVLGAITISATRIALDNARQRATMADMRTISRAIEAYVVDHELIPVYDGGLADLQEQISGYTNSSLPVHDSWGNEYLFSKGGDQNYTLVSLGKDGLDGADYVRAAKFDFNRDLVMYNGIFIAAPE